MINTTIVTPEEQAYANKLFAGECTFVAGATTEEIIPFYELPEIVFCGLSNVGKSSLINSLTFRKTLARTSHTPGRTQQLNFFKLRDDLILVDLPGYGYAKASKVAVRQWNKLILSYLKGRVNLKRVFILIDIRRNIKDSDKEIMKYLDEVAVPYQIVLTKYDKIKKVELENCLNKIKNDTENFIALHPEIIVTSGHDNYNIDYLRAVIANLTKK